MTIADCGMRTGPHPDPPPFPGEGGEGEKPKSEMVQ
jgi:hypothetical protein